MTTFPRESMFAQPLPGIRPPDTKSKPTVARKSNVEIPVRDLENWYDTLNRLDDTQGDLLDLRDAIYRYLR